MNDRKEPAISETVRLEIGANIKSRRERLGLTRAALGRRLVNAEGNAVEEAQIYQWETGRSTPSPPYRPQLADALETDEANVFGALVADPQSTLSLQVDQVREEIGALAAILGVSDEQIDVMVRRRRRARRATSPLVGETDHDPSSLIPGQDLPGAQDDAEPGKGSRRPRRGRATGKGRDKP